MDKEKPGPAYVKGTSGGGKVFFINFYGKKIKVFYGSDEYFCLPKALAAVDPEQKADNPEPKTYKIQIHGNPGRGKGDLFIQGMVHPGNGNAPRQKSGPELEEKETVQNRPNTPEAVHPQKRRSQCPYNRHGERFIINRSFIKT
jgi:hypothetical protein